METPLVSIIVPVYNGERFVAEAIESVLAQTYKNYEIIVVNDGSTDRTADIVKSYGDKISYYYQANKGPSAARNLGIRNSNGALIAFLDADDVWVPHKLEVQVEFMNAHSQYAVTYSDRMTIDQGGKCLKKSQNWNCPSGDIFEKQFMANYIATPTVMCYRNCFNEVGYFDESPEMRGSEDYNMWLRLSNCYKFGYIDMPLTMVRFHSMGTSRVEERLYHGEIYTVHQALKLFGDKRPILKQLAKRRLFQIYYDYGITAFFQDNYKLARLSLGKALMYKPFNLNIWPRFLISFLPAKLIGVLKVINRKLS